MAILDEVKSALRLSSTAPAGIVQEAETLIAAAFADLGLAGLDPTKLVESDPLVKLAVITYCKAHFGYDNPDADRLLQSYLHMKAALALAAIYQPPEEDG